MISEKQALDKLSLCYEQAQAANTPDIFFLMLYKVMEEYDANPLLEQIDKLIIEEQKNELATFINLDEQLKKEMKEAYEKIKNFIFTNKIIDPCIIAELNHFESLMQFPIESGLATTLDMLLSLRCMLIFLTRNTFDEFYLNFLHQFAVIEKGEISNFTCVPTLDNWEKEERKIKDTKKTRIWYVWFKLIEFYKTHNPQTYVKSGEMSLYKYYLQIIYHFTKQSLTFLDFKRKQDCFASNLFYDQSEGVLYIAGKTISINGETAQGRFTGLFFPNCKRFNELIHRDEIHKDVFQTLADHDMSIGRAEKDQVYGLRREVNKKIKKATAIDDFFVLKDCCIGINQQYK